MANYDPHPNYYELPESVRVTITEKEFAWLGDIGRAQLLGDCCCPDFEGDDC